MEKECDVFKTQKIQYTYSWGSEWLKVKWGETLRSPTKKLDLRG